MITILSPDASNKMKKSAGGINLKQATKMAIAAVLFYAIVQRMRKHYWYAYDNSTVTTERFYTNTTFIRNEVPVTYYRKGQLDKVLPPNGWISDRGDSGLRLFRLDPTSGDSVDFDYSVLNGPTGAKKLVECEGDGIHGVGWCAGSSCFERELVMSDFGSILNGTAADHYATFSYISDKGVRDIQKAVELPFNMDRGIFEQAFVSNLKKDVFITPLHGAVTNSMAVQVVGSKFWIFFRREDYVGDHGWAAKPTLGPEFPSKAPDSESMDYWTYKSQPGDLLYFPPSYGHVVATAAGPNVMINFRKIFPQNFLLNHPFVTMTALFNIMFHRTPGPDAQRVANEQSVQGKKFKQAAGHTNLITDYAYDLIGKAVCEDASPHSADRKLAQLMHDFMDSTYE